MARRRGVDGFGLSTHRAQSSTGALASVVRAREPKVSRSIWGVAPEGLTLVSGGGDPNAKMTTFRVAGRRIARPDVFGDSDFILGPDVLDVSCKGALTDALGHLVMDDSTGPQGRHPLLAERWATTGLWGPSFAPDGRPRVIAPSSRPGLLQAVRERYDASWSVASSRPRALSDWLFGLASTGQLAVTQHDALGRVLSPTEAELRRLCSGEPVRFDLTGGFGETEGGFPVAVDMALSFRKSDLVPFFSAMAFYSDATGIPTGNIREAKRLSELWDSVGFTPTVMGWERAEMALEP